MKKRSSLLTLLCTTLIRAQHTPKLTQLPNQTTWNRLQISPFTPFKSLCPPALQLPHQWPFSFSCDSHQHSHTQGTKVSHNSCAHSTPEELLDSPLFLFCWASVSPTCFNSSACQNLPTATRVHSHNMPSNWCITTNHTHTRSLTSFKAWDSSFGHPSWLSSFILVHHWYLLGF